MDKYVPDSKSTTTCPDYIVCDCGGDIVEHMINSTALGKGFVDGLIAAIPFSGGTLLNALSGSENGNNTWVAGGDDGKMAYSDCKKSPLFYYLLLFTPILSQHIFAYNLFIYISIVKCN